MTEPGPEPGPEALIFHVDGTLAETPPRPVFHARDRIIRDAKRLGALYEPVDQMEADAMGAIVFDLDGTLVDSAPDIAAAANRALAEFGRSPLPLPQLTSFIGHGIPELVRRVIEACELDPAIHPEMNTRLLAHYSACPAELTRTYPGVREALTSLRERGHSLGVCTNKNRGLSVQILDALDLSAFFDVVIGGDSLSVKKPDPAPLDATFAELTGAPLCYVGDSEVDAQTALNAGLDFALFTEGYRQTPVTAIRHSFAFDRYDDLLAFVEQLARGNTG